MKRILTFLCALLLLLPTACAPVSGQPACVIVTTTYPTYLLTCALTRGLEHVQVERLNTGSVSCLHDYTLSVTDMKRIDRANVLVLSGAGLEDFMDDALAQSTAEVIDCSAHAYLLPSAGHGDHDHHDHEHGHFDPHYWLDPVNAAAMTDALLEGLLPLLKGQEPLLQANAATARTALLACDTQLQQVRTQTGALPGLISFHDGFAYLAHACNVPVLRSIEEEAGSEASAREIVEVSALVRDNHIPLIFTEINGSDATAKAIARETGCDLACLSTLMDGPDAEDLSSTPEEYYASEIMGNAATLINGLAGREVVHPT